MSIEVRRIPISSIQIGDRLRLVDPDRAAFIGAGMAAVGQIQPIEVRPIKAKKYEYALVVGGHRLAGAELIGWTEIDAIVTAMTAEQARMREIDENVYRAELSDLDRAVFLAEKKRLYEQLHPETKHGGDRRSDQAAIFGDLAPRFTEEVKERLGYSERTIQRIVARANIAPAVRARISSSWLASKGGDLDALARLPPEDQLATVDLLLGTADDRPRSVAAATALVRGQRPAVVSPEDAQANALMAAWRRAGAPARRRFLEHLADTGEIPAATKPPVRSAA